MVPIQQYKEKILAGERLTRQEALSLDDILPDQFEELWQAAEEITEALCAPVFDSCSIINARSGRCPENCKWCAQSAHYHTDIDQYPLLPESEVMRVADHNRAQGIKRFSIVTSGRAMHGDDLRRACDYFRILRRRGGMQLCASMGLLNEDELRLLRDAGVTRYHCNLEAAPSYFSRLCSTHTVEDKIRTINIARDLGMEVCSGGIIGMGETRRQRIELALELLRVDPRSIPINLLSPIPGTPLESTEPLDEEEVLTTVAIFRFIHPDKTLRFAGGRARLSEATQLRALRIGINGAIVGDLLTTIGSTVPSDRTLASRAGYTW